MSAAKFTDLSERVKDKLRDKIRYWFVQDEWWDFTYDDAKTIGALMGIEVSNIWFSIGGQGNGATISGQYSYEPGAVEKIKAHAPQDQELLRIASELTALQIAQKLRGFNPHFVYITNNNFQFDEYDGPDEDDNDEFTDSQDAFIRVLSDFISWIYDALEAEHDYLTSDEYLDEWLSESDNLSSIYDEAEFEEHA